MGSLVSYHMAKGMQLRLIGALEKNVLSLCFCVTCPAIGWLTSYSGPCQPPSLDKVTETDGENLIGWAEEQRK